MPPRCILERPLARYNLALNDENFRFPSPEREIQKATELSPTAASIRLIAVDLDGTLLTARKSISARTHTALRAAMV